MDIDRSGYIQKKRTVITEKGEITVEELIPAEMDESTLRKALKELQGIMSICEKATEDD